VSIEDSLIEIHGAEVTLTTFTEAEVDTTSYPTTDHSGSDSTIWGLIRPVGGYLLGVNLNRMGIGSFSEADHVGMFKRDQTLPMGSHVTYEGLKYEVIEPFPESLLGVAQYKLLRLRRLDLE